jgi:hypothetical protein
MGIYSLDENYDVTTWYDYNGAFDLNAGTDLLLDQTRQLMQSDAYVFQGVAFPKGTDVEIDFQGTFSGSLNLIPYSYIFALTGFSQNDGQYTLRIYDKGAQTDLYYGQFAWYPTVMGTMRQQFSASGEFITTQTPDIPFGPYFFRAPLIVLPPGSLQVQLTNALPMPQPSLPIERVQLLFHVAAPKNTTTLSTRKIQTASDQTGVQSIGALASLLPG